LRFLFHLLLNLLKLFEYLVGLMVLAFVRLAQEKESLLLEHQREQGTFAQP
jgi:hypothetical protein